jgi:hypothetical protein
MHSSATCTELGGARLVAEEHSALLHLLDEGERLGEELLLLAHLQSCNGYWSVTRVLT